MNAAERAPNWAKRLFFLVLNRLPESWQWFIWHLVRPTYLVGVVVVVLRKNKKAAAMEVLLIEKRHGLLTGIQLPGGGLDKNLSVPESARKELFEETGLKNVSIDACYPSCNNRHGDVHFVFAARPWGLEETPQPKDTFEIKRAFWATIAFACDNLLPEHQRMLEQVILSEIEER